MCNAVPLFRSKINFEVKMQRSAPNLISIGVGASIHLTQLTTLSVTRLRRSPKRYKEDHWRTQRRFRGFTSLNRQIFFELCVWKISYCPYSLHPKFCAGKRQQLYTNFPFFLQLLGTKSPRWPYRIFDPTGPHCPLSRTHHVNPSNVRCWCPYEEDCFMRLNTPGSTRRKTVSCCLI